MSFTSWENVPEDTLIQGIKRRVVTGDKVMLGRLTFPKGAKVPAHQHESEQMTQVFEGALQFEVDGETVIVRPGDVLFIPSGVVHSAEALEDTLEIDAFGPIRTDWLDGSDAYIRDEK